MITVFIVGGIVVLNVLATRYVIRRSTFTSERFIAIPLIWLIPIVGTIGAWMWVTPASRQSAVAPKELKLTHEFEQIAAPAHVGTNAGPDFAILDHLTFTDGLPFLDWQAFSDWANSLPVEKEKTKAIREAQRAWLLHLREALGPHYHVYSIDRVWVLSPLHPNMCKALAKYVRTTRSRLGDKLAHLAHFDPAQPSIVVVAEDEETYYRYVATYYPDGGEFALSGGMYIHNGCPHLVIKAGSLDQLEPVIVHEMTHGSLAHLSLPKWLDEGIAVSTEHAVIGMQPFSSPAATRQREHKEFWNPERIQEFWPGISFLRSDAGNKLSYDLANILVMHLAANWNAFVQFAAHASVDDGGKLAAMDVYSIDLGALVCEIVGQDDCEMWSPNSALWSTRG